MLDSKLITFLAVAEHRSYTLAAEALGLTQPAVTQHIKKLEEHYGARLTEGSGKTFRLTPAGKALFYYASLQSVNEQLLLKRLKGLIEPLRIGATLSIADYYLPSVLLPYLAAAGQSCSVTAGNTERLLDGLLHGRLDCAFIEGIFDAELFEAKVFYQARFLPVASACHPLAGKPVTLAQLYPYPLVLREPGSGTRAILEGYLQQKNDSIHSFARITQISSFVLMKELLEHSQGISFMYEAVAQQEVKQGRLTYLCLADGPAPHALHFVYLKNSLASEQCQELYQGLQLNPTGLSY